VILGCIAIAAGVMTPAATSAEPGGNNGTVKVDGGALNGNSNEPHVGCTFYVEWFDFDPGASSTVTFSMQSPTDTPTTAGAPTSTAFGRYTLDASGNYNHSFDIYDLVKNFTPQPNQGFHVKLEIETTWSNGSDTKHKTFWMTSCGNPPAETGSVSLAKVVSGPAPAGDPDYSFTVTSDDPGATVSSPVALKASGAPVTVASGVAVGSTVTITETGANGAASTSYSVDNGPAQPGSSVVVPVSAATSVAVVATNTFTAVLGEETSRQAPTTTQYDPGQPTPTAALPSELARTGSNRLPLALVGLALIGGGLALSAVGRRRLRMSR
jgi:hypothetical protein